MRGNAQKVITNHEIDIPPLGTLNYFLIVGKPRLFFNHMAIIRYAFDQTPPSATA